MVESAVPEVGWMHGGDVQTDRSVQFSAVEGARLHR